MSRLPVWITPSAIVGKCGQALRALHHLRINDNKSHFYSSVISDVRPPFITNKDEVEGCGCNKHVLWSPSQHPAAGDPAVAGGVQ